MKQPPQPARICCFLSLLLLPASETAAQVQFTGHIPVRLQRFGAVLYACIQSANESSRSDSVRRYQQSDQNGKECSFFISRFYAVSFGLTAAFFVRTIYAAVQVGRPETDLPQGSVSAPKEIPCFHQNVIKL